MGKQQGPSNPGGDAAGMLAQLARVQNEMRRIQRELEQETVTATADGGAVTIVMTGGQQVRSVKLTPEVMRQADPDRLGDMLTSAFNQAVKASKDLARRKLGPLMP